MTWLLGLMGCFVFLGTRRRPARVSRHLVALILILIGVAYETFKLRVL